jgi:hypothetical protein
MKKILAVCFIVFSVLFSTNLLADDFYVERIPLDDGTTLVIVWSSDRGHVVHEYIEVD